MYFDQGKRSCPGVSLFLVIWICNVFQSEYEDRLHKALEELRSVYDKKMQQSSDDFAKMYDERVRDLQTQLSKER